jgi:lipopolysaccharide biosynthesis glycosyltransferase
MSKVLCTIANDKFVNGLIVTISSFLEHNNFDGDIIIFVNEQYSKISDENKNFISKKINHKINYREIDQTNYIELIDYFKIKADGNDSMLRLIPSIFTFDCFDLCGDYDQVLYLDSDMLIRSDIMGLFTISDSGIYVTPALLNYQPNIRYGEFNGGFLFLNKIGVNSKKNELINTGLRMNEIKLLDQPILNKVLYNEVIYLSCDYNCGKRMFSDFTFNLFNNNVKIIHYVGAKPWDLNKIGFESNYNFIEKLWFDYYNKIMNQNYAKV